MAQFIELPHVGESVVEGTIGKWLKQPGDHVERYDPLVEVVTDKVTMEVPSPVSGELLRIIAQEGETVPMGAPIAEVETQGSPAPAAAQPAATSSEIGAVETGAAKIGAAEIGGSQSGPSAAVSPDPAASSATVPVAYLIDAQPVGPTGGSAVEALAEAEAAAAAPTPVAPTPALPTRPQPSAAHAVIREGGGAKGPNRLSPAVRRLARERNVNVDDIAGTGMGGRVTRNDVLRYLESGTGRVGEPVARELGTGGASLVGAPESSAPTPEREPGSRAPGPRADGPEEERTPLTPVRRMIAQAMERSAREIPHAWSMVEVDITRLVALRGRERDGFRSREGVNLTYLPFALKAVAGALKDNPTLNASWGDDCIVLKRRINLGIAVAAPSGLVVPVIHDADRLSIAGLAHAVGGLSTKAHAGNLRLEDVQGGTFTVNNTGALGSVLGGPIINHPQAAIITTEAAQQRPVVINDAIAIRWMMNLCLSFDHRINDGAEAGAFLQSVKGRLEAFDGDTPIY